ncbi:cardiolipin synthase [Butyrivibrio sp. JL13D10]|uniref:cardiolipin synthase n=1 Tax=Butyrivibrio sp. JL13D10 TaxID=3236815 RepID=UPI0038B4CCA8
MSQGLNSEKKMTTEHRGYVKNGLSRMIVSAIAFFLQVIFLIMAISMSFSRAATIVQMIMPFFAAVLVFMIYSRDRTSALKAPWMIIIAAFPLAGAVMYLMIGTDSGTKKMKRRFAVVDEKLDEYLPENKEEARMTCEFSRSIGGIASYVKKFTNYPIYKNTDVSYYSNALDGLKDQIKDIQKAESFVFLEYHAIEDAEAFHMLEDELVKCVGRGVDVRIFYDDIGSIGFITTDFVGRMEKLGIKCKVFNAVSPVLNFFFNNRDHRKITVIDGKVGYTGGYNIANEYFEFTHPYGHWKDTGLRLEGDAVRSLTLTFLEMWYASEKVRWRDIEKDRGLEVSKFLPEISYRAKGKALVLPYADSPFRHEPVAENVYISMVEKAHEYCYFITPYLIPSDEMIRAMSLAAKRGIDVRIITPGVPDKKITYSVTRSYYSTLTASGVRIFEWTPGFCHAKMCVIDDRVAVCGTINLDFRSLYHHFENGCMVVDYEIARQIREDMDKTMAESQEVTHKYSTGRRLTRAGQGILRIFAPLF